MLLGLRTVIYPAPDLAAGKAWFTSLLGAPPYFDEPFYVGFEVAGYELGLVPAGTSSTGPVTYWGVPDVAVALASLLAAGSVLGFIENPHFALPETETAPGPGR